MKNFEQSATIWMANHRVRGVTFFFHALTHIFDFWGWIFFFSLLFILNLWGIELLPQQNLFISTIKMTAIAWGSTLVIKIIVRRKRPAQVIKELESIGPAPYNTSFPSSHASAIVSFFCGLALVNHPLASVVGVITILVLFSRFYLGAHFVSDIIAGAVWGSMVVLLINSIC